MIGLIAGGLSAQPSIAAAAPGSCLGFASRGCLVQGAEGGGGRRKGFKIWWGNGCFATSLFAWHVLIKGFWELLVGAPGVSLARPRCHAVPRVMWDERGEESLVPGCLAVPARPRRLLGMEMIILIKQLCWEEGSGLSWC